MARPNPDRRTQGLLAMSFLAAALSACNSRSASPETASGAHPESSEYDGPAGTKWGEGPEEAKKALVASGLSFQGQDELGPGHVKQTFGGTYSGFATESVTTDFREGKLIAIIMMLPAADARPASQRWQEMVDATSRTSGAPSKVTPLPQTGGVTDYLALDQKIKQGVPSPHATWFFKDVVVAISINGSKLDGKGGRLLRPSWGFFGPGAFHR
jgi:hypothetical protein